MPKLDDILANEDADRLTGELQGLILDRKPDEDTWSWPERLVVILGSMERWVIDGGFDGYLRMPTSCAVEDCIIGLREIGCGAIAEALAHALSLFPEGDNPYDSVWVRQEFERSPEVRERLFQDSRFFWNNFTMFQEKLVSYIRQNRSAFVWIDGLTEGQPPTAVDR